MRIAVKGIGVAGGFGCGVADLSRALAKGMSPLGSIQVPTAGGPVELPALRAETSRLEEFVPRRHLRRIDHYSKLGLLGAFLALEDAGMPEGDHGRIGVIVASGYGATATTFAFLDSIINDGDICASPTHFANSVHNAAAANISILLGAKGPSLTVSQFDLSVPSALMSARQWLAEERVDAVLFGALDELSDLTGYAWHRSRPAQLNPRLFPLATAEESAVMGEGSAFFLLCRDDGKGDGYCTIEEIATGRRLGRGAPLTADRLLLLGADGRRELGRRYREELPLNARIACYTPLYGSTPAASGFDLAVAALILRGGKVFATPGGAMCDIPGALIHDGTMPATRVSCLTLAGDDDYGVVTLGGL